jgi:hypothetical protein
MAAMLAQSGGNFKQDNTGPTQRRMQDVLFWNAAALTRILLRRIFLLQCCRADHDYALTDFLVYIQAS